MISHLRISPYVQGCFVQLNPQDPRLHHEARAAVVAVIDVFDRIDRTAEQEHRTLSAGTVDPMEQARNIDAWSETTDAIGETLRGLTDALSSVERWKAEATRKPFAVRQQVESTRLLLTDALVQLSSMQRACLVHRSRDPFAPADTIATMLSVAASSTESIAALRSMQ